MRRPYPAESCLRLWRRALEAEVHIQSPHQRRFSFVKSSTKDKIKGRIEEAKGKVKEKTGEATGDSDLRDRGTGEKAVGKIQRKIGDVKKVFGK
jgi:uncharacterized protein YjbJ (UPF0337 family)